MGVPHAQQGLQARRINRRRTRISRNRIHLIAKRSLDILIAISALMILLPFLLSVAALIKLTSPGPVLFRQIRWGRDQQKIRIYKFRTMYAAECDDSGVRQTTENDPRITAVGAVLRRTNIDELPQLLNVLKGDMSLVGPRCHAIGMLAAGMPYEDLVADYHHRHQVKPGLTGLAQMRGLRGPTGSVAKARARIAADLFYVDNFSFWLDIKIILGTIHSELTCGKGF
ncbi:sugar transferase [Agrobacterium vitis]|uniref:Sugar transferase n=1 Tax=Agrobacterium vitis TaxID=373 RepID=A0A368NR76_AGRVI|nr:sugar transferase [Agrobacterium vitis]KAA3517479.1 sugar transferase [Agrobacterium vitis]KAA3526880.1 sugar transferase [Agrobacterium vitis]MCF1477107.1 sugar transferase [Agrobacterium vitis]MUZ95709.1 sugar transferase [Agrobacterium vitis]MVA30735.1 sugar transferase [Agrobacterium vitis]